MAFHKFIFGVGEVCINCLIFLTTAKKKASFCKKTKNLINHYQNEVV